MFAENAILFSEIVNHIFLVAIHPASNSEHEELQRMGHRGRLLGRDARHRTARNDSPGLGRFFPPCGNGVRVNIRAHKDIRSEYGGRTVVYGREAYDRSTP